MHSVEDLLIAAYQVRLAYTSHDHSVDNVEFLHLDVDDYQVLAFKGTSRNENDGSGGFWALLRDILSDVRFLPRVDNDYGLGRHPAGFLNAAEDLVEYVLNEETDIDPKTPIHLCGHSLGGAVLLIAAPVMIKHGLPVQSIITYGAPNIGKLPEMPGVAITCLRNGRDIVTEVPPFYGDTIEHTAIGQAGGMINDHLLENYILSLSKMVTLKGTRYV